MGTPAYQVTVVLDKRLFAIIASYRKRMEAASPGMKVSISNAIRGLIARGAEPDDFEKALTAQVARTNREAKRRSA
jgi:hypothetical protein